MENINDFSQRELEEYLSKNVNRHFGKIKDYEFTIFDGNDGYFIWDFNIVNEIVFVNTKTNDYISLFANVNEDKTEEIYLQLLKRYCHK